MGINKLLSIFFNDVAIFKFSKKKQIDYINKLGEPKDEIDRSFYQFKCQMHHLNIIQRLFLNVISWLALLIISFKKKRQVKFKENFENVLVFVHDERNVPLKYRQDNYIQLENVNGSSWSQDTKLLYAKIKKRYRCHPFFLLKVYKKLSFYQFIIDSYNPKNIITSNEYSFTSSVLTLLANIECVNHIDVMHGEKVFYFGEAFFCFNKVYVWDEYYIDLFNELKAKYDEIEVYFPISRFIVSVAPNPSVDITYYLQMQNKKEMKKICKALKSTGFDRIAIRPHPRYTNMKVCKSIFRCFEVEDTSQITIEASIARTKRVVSQFSTVSLQASSSNIKYFIDDISDVYKFNRLNDLGYRLIQDNKFSSLTN